MSFYVTIERQLEREWEEDKRTWFNVLVFGSVEVSADGSEHHVTLLEIFSDDPRLESLDDLEASEIESIELEMMGWAPRLVR